MMTRRKFALGFSAFLLGGCSSQDLVSGIGAAVQGRSIDGAVRAVAQGRLNRWARNPKNLIRDIENFDQFTRKFLSDIVQVWGEEAAKAPSDQVFVKYDQDYQSRIMVDFAQGFVRIESFDQDRLPEAIVLAVLSPENPEDIDLFSDQPPKLGGQPFLFEQVLDQDQKPIRWRWRAERFARFRMSQGLEQALLHIPDQGKKTLYAVQFPLVRSHQANRQNKYAPLVARYGAQFDQPRALISAIIEVESSFNPYAVSWVPAYGLMQIVPKTAGRDAYEFLYGRKGTPDRDYLFNPQNNIRMGSAYLHLLDRRYLGRVQHPLSRKFCVIAAYNGGIGNVLRSFSPQQNRSLPIINKSRPERVFSVLKAKMPDETKRYLDKVLKAEKKYA